MTKRKLKCTNLGFYTVVLHQYFSRTNVSHCQLNQSKRFSPAVASTSHVTSEPLMLRQQCLRHYNIIHVT